MVCQIDDSELRPLCVIEIFGSHQSLGIAMRCANDEKGSAFGNDAPIQRIVQRIRWKSLFVWQRLPWD